tara:strand:- start:6089 stop:6838 length:750 start_codon:yes stop_codon:yes gene_type:complete
MISGTIAVWFSCGAASAVAARMTVDLYGSSCNVRIINNPVAEEDEDNRRFLADVAKWIGRDIETAASARYPSASARDVWAHRKFMSGPTGAPCTVELKKKARQDWEGRNPVDWHVLGFTADEQVRHKRFILTERSNVIPVLIDAKFTKTDCYRTLKEAGIKPPRVYEMGYPNANCIGCVKATSPTYWNHVRRAHPDVFDDRATQSRELGVRLARHKNKRVFLDELPADAIGRPMKNLDFECGTFCEERL